MALLTLAVIDAVGIKANNIGNILVSEQFR